MRGVVSGLVALLLLGTGCRSGSRPGREAEPSAPPAADESGPTQADPVDRLLAGLRVGMTRDEIHKAVADQGLEIGACIRMSVADPATHLTFQGSDSGPVAFEFDAGGRLVRWERWRADGRGGFERSADISAGPVRGQVRGSFSRPKD
jgi:hypothetical protein